jgi:hypothetical protein
MNTQANGIMFFQRQEKDMMPIVNYSISTVEIQNKKHEQIRVIKDTDETSAFNSEKSLISYIGRLDLNTGPLANLTEGGDGTSHLLPIIKGKTYEEIYGKEKALKLKEVRRVRMLGKKNPMFGKSGPMLGKKLDEVARKKVSVSRRLKVNQLDLNGNLIRTWDTVEEAANHVGIYYSGIQHVASRISSDRTAGDSNGNMLAAAINLLTLLLNQCILLPMVLSLKR